jgi:Thiol-disulfide isomerase and thioredoxins
MKKLLLIAIAAILLAACVNKNAYTVTGTIEGGANGDMVYLQQSQISAAFDSVKIENGKFVFKGVQENPEIVYISAPTKSLFLNFVLESGNINLTVTKSDDRDLRTGTENNDKLQDALTKIATVGGAVDENFALVMTSDLSDEKIVEVKKNIFLAIDEYNKVYEECTKDVENDFVAKYIAANRRKIELTEEALDGAIKMGAEQRKATEKTAVGAKFTNFTGSDVDGKNVEFSTYVGNGKYILVDFWASWCKPCIAEIPNLVKIYDKYKNQGFEIVSISIDREKNDWIKALNDNDMPWSHLLDANGAASSIYGINSIPHIMLIDKDGQIIGRELRGKSLEKKLEEVFGN